MQKIHKNLKTILFSSVILITIALWTYTKVAIENEDIFSSVLKNSAQVFGLLAVVFFGINFLLATRFYFIENLFGGLDKMYKFHKLIARIAFTLAWAHPILLLLRNFRGIESLQRYFVPDDNVRLNMGIFALYLMTLLVLFSVTKFLPYQIWKNSHRLMVFVMVFLFVHLVNAPGTIDSNILLKIWIYGWILVAVLCWIYIELLYKRIGPVFYYKVSKINKLGNVNELYFEPQNKPMVYHAGQFTFMSFINNKEIQAELHPFTISSNPHEYYIRISAKNSGDYTSTLDKVNVGDMVKLIGPYGYFTRDRLISFKNQIWIAGGIGVTPFLSMLAMEKDEPTGNKINFFYTTKTEEEAVYKDEILKDAENLTDLKVNLNVDTTDGYLSAKKIQEKIDFDLKEAHILLCGPAAMMYSLRKQFKELGLTDEQIIFEDFALKPV